MKNYKRRLSLMFIAVTTVFCLAWCFINETNAYEVCFNGRVIGYIKNASDFENVNKETYNEVQNRFSKLNYKDEVYLNKVLVDEKCLTSRENLKSAIINNSKSEVAGVMIKSNNSQVGLVASENEGENVIEGIKKYYISKCGLSDSIQANCKNKISYEKVNLKISQIKKVEDVTAKVIDINNNNKNPIVSILIKGNINKEESILPSTVITWSDSLAKGKSNKKSSGKSGKKLVTYRIAMENMICSSKEKVKEKVIEKPEDIEIVKGTKESVALASSTFNIPSRGFVSSNFGMRQGKMHNGIDIAANQGDPIYAVLSGKVVYADWEEGYGKLIKIDNGSGTQTFYGHCSSIEVKVGETVEKGKMIGKVGSTGRSTGPHVHFEVRVNNKPQNPAKYLK